MRKDKNEGEDPAILTFQEFMKAQVEEIKKYKWIESEKAGKDIGQVAIKDWISKYAPVFREEWEKKYGFYY